LEILIRLIRQIDPFRHLTFPEENENLIIVCWRVDMKAKGPSNHRAHSRNVARHNWGMTRLVAPVLAPGSLSSRQQPVLPVDDRFVLRPWSEKDAPALFAAYADPDIQHWSLNTFDAAECEQLIVKWNDAWRNEAGAHWAIAMTADDLAIGRVGLRMIDLNGGEAEVSYWVASQARGVGVASLATGTLSEWLLEDLGLHRLELGHSVHNPASCHVASNAGFVAEGTLRSALLHSDGWHDMHWHARVAQ
jgi:RimJ/RimL family protein N-acetyltransferase